MKQMLELETAGILINRGGFDPSRSASAMVTVERKEKGRGGEPHTWAASRRKLNNGGLLANSHPHPPLQKTESKTLADLPFVFDPSQLQLTLRRQYCPDIPLCPDIRHQNQLAYPISFT